MNPTTTFDPSSATTDAASPGRERRAAARAAIPAHIERLAWTSEQLAAHQRDRLRTVLARARSDAPFHTERLADIDPATVELVDLASLPTMTKADLMARFDDTVTDRRIDRALVEAHLAATGFDAEELLGRYLVLASGGSSGERGVFVYDRDAAIEFLMALVRYGMARMVALLGDLPAEPPSMAFVAAGSAVHATRALASLFAGDFMEVTSIPATQPIDQTVATLNALQPLLLQGYPSIIRHLADEQAAGRLDLSLLGVTTTSEQLTADARARIDEVFGTGVSDMFGSSEGLLGMSPPDDPAIVLASDVSYVELVDDHGAPVPVGTPSAKVLVTSLANTTQPLIRYELPDRMVRLPDAEHHPYPRVLVEGRRDEELRWGDVVVHPLAVRSVLVQTPQVVEYQTRQTERGLDLAVVAPTGLDEAGLAHRVAASLRTAGVADATATVTAVAPADLQRNERTGKTRRFIPLPG